MRGVSLGFAERKVTRPRDSGCSTTASAVTRCSRSDERPPDLGVHAHGIAHELNVRLRESGFRAYHDIAAVDLRGAGTASCEHPLQHRARNSVGAQMVEKGYVAASGELDRHARMLRQVAADGLEIGVHRESKGTQVVGGPYAREHQQLRRIEGAAA